MVNESTYFTKNVQEWEIIDAYVKRRIVSYDETMMMVYVHFQKDGIGPIHHHYHTQSTYIAEGKFEVTIDNETQILGKGDSFFIPSSIEHGVKCLEEGMLIDVFSPMREDFISKTNE
ncbi:cupin domain-containing protein [Subsaxibacter sp. CAU 1640]|uniref:cupin domain-containing protein n=1 Tax=Subsaxibacter sp. CAU 1640 TaxID=2933271 RepID=UPI0020061A7B|nr:cupin domain-containing protein [Subsaxibacter sp. CAU 1640]MCK7589094.1 cupin domain-containing protein [Subsaxibacter sp. CAU 1640]